MSPRTCTLHVSTGALAIVGESEPRFRERVKSVMKLLDLLTRVYLASEHANAHHEFYATWRPWFTDDTSTFDLEREVAAQLVEQLLPIYESWFARSMPGAGTILEVVRDRRERTSTVLGFQVAMAIAHGLLMPIGRRYPDLVPLGRGRRAPS